MTAGNRAPNETLDQAVTRTSDRAAGRTEGYAPIADYACLGDGRTVALLASDGRIDWWPLPTLDSPPAFAALLDAEDGGHLALSPVESFTVSRRYVDKSNVVATTFTTATGTVEVTDALTVGLAGRLPWAELTRRVQGRSGSVRMRWLVAPGTRFRSAQPWTSRHGATPLLHLGDQQLALRCFDVGEPAIEGHQVSGEFVAEAGSSGLLTVVGTDGEPTFLPNRKHLERRLDATVHNWQEWADALRYDGPWARQVCRSALALKLLLYAPTGAIAAAPTTSLPERIGGPKNWDYRYAWIRDSSFTLDALINLELHEEVHAAVSWLLDTVASTAPDLHVFYKLDGRVPSGESELAVPGYRGSVPVRAGNGAAKQSQLGTFGDFFDTVWRYVEHGHVLDASTTTLLGGLADRCCDQWAEKDAGIWELGQLEHYTISKIGCWVALDRAVRLSEVGQLTNPHVHRWQLERAAVHDWVDAHCWSPRKQAYTFYAGTEDLDAAVLLAGRTGFDRGARLASTVQAVRAELGRGPLLYRYTGMDNEEGAFIACSFWLVTALVSLGRGQEARALMDELVELVNDVGLLSEQVDPTSRELLGNFPQALSHLALINAASDCARDAARAGQAHEEDN